MGQLSKPTRDRYRLTDWAETSYEDWKDLGGCTCFTGCAPCHSCTHEGHPYSLEEDDDAWEPEFTEYLIDYTDDKGLPTCNKGHCAGSGYCVESCLYFEKIESNYVGFEKIYCRFIEEEPNEMSRNNITNKGGNNNTHKFKVGDKVRRTGCNWAGIIKGEVYTVSSVASNGSIEVDEVDTGICGYACEEYFELTLPESNIQPQPSTTLNTHKHNGLCKETPLTSKPIECTIQLPGAVKSIEVNLTNFLNQQEESNMSNTNRRVVNVKLLDNDSGLPVEDALVAQFDNIVTEDSNDVVVQEILLNKKIADAIAKHNQKRVEQTDLEILKRTGNDVKLRPVKLKDLTWVVTTA